jgi:hypothetical protein
VQVSLQLQLGNAVHTTKFLSFSEGRMLGMTVLGKLLAPEPYTLNPELPNVNIQLSSRDNNTLPHS